MHFLTLLQQFTRFQTVASLWTFPWDWSWAAPNTFYVSKSFECKFWIRVAAVVHQIVEKYFYCLHLTWHTGRTTDYLQYVTDDFYKAKASFKQLIKQGPSWSPQKQNCNGLVTEKQISWKDRFQPISLGIFYEPRLDFRLGGRGRNVSKPLRSSIYNSKFACRKRLHN